MSVTVSHDVVTDLSLILHAPPDFVNGAQIIGVCTVSDADKDPNEYGWMIADFLRWKSLLYGVGPRENQVWLSSLDIVDFVAKHGGPYANDANLLDKIVGRHRDHIQVCSSSPHLVATLLSFVSEFASAAKSKSTGVVIIICGPTSPDQDIWLDTSCSPPLALTVQKIQQTILESVSENSPSITLVTSSPLTTGWMCRPVLYGKDAPISTNKTEEMMARACGSAFGNSLVTEFTTSSTPFLSPQGRSKFQYTDIMPIGPSPKQVMLLHQFHAKIHETMKQRFCSLASEHAFHFQHSDAWDLLGRSLGRPLSSWAEQWHGGSQSEAVTKGFDFLGKEFGGTRASQTFYLRFLVTVELHSCFGDWKNNSTGTTREMFDSFLKAVAHDITDDAAHRVFNALEYRASCITLVELVAKKLNIRSTDGKKCRFWIDEHGDDPDLYRKRQAAFAMLHNLFNPITLLPGETCPEFKTVRFPRPARWLAAAIAPLFIDKHDAEMQEFVTGKVRPAFAAIKNDQRKLLATNRSVIEHAHSWLKSILKPAEAGDLVGLTEGTHRSENSDPENRAACDNGSPAVLEEGKKPTLKSDGSDKSKNPAPGGDLNHITQIHPVKTTTEQPVPKTVDGSEPVAVEQAGPKTNARGENIDKNVPTGSAISHSPGLSAQKSKPMSFPATGRGKSALRLLQSFCERSYDKVVTEENAIQILEGLFTEFQKIKKSSSSAAESCDNRLENAPTPNTSPVDHGGGGSSASDEFMTPTMSPVGHSGTDARLDNAPTPSTSPINHGQYQSAPLALSGTVAIHFPTPQPTSKINRPGLGPAPTKSPVPRLENAKENIPFPKDSNLQAPRDEVSVGGNKDGGEFGGIEPVKTTPSSDEYWSQRDVRW